MPIVTCLLSSAFIWRFVGKKKDSLIRLFCITILLTTIIYSYYIGYSTIDLKAAFLKISPNSIYCSVMSVIAAGLISVIKLYKNNRREKYLVKIEYHMESADKKIFRFLIVIAFFVRVIGVNWGAGETFHPDEGKVVRPPIQMAEECILMSDELEAPSQITSRVLSIVFKIVMIVASILDIEVSVLTYVIITRTYMAILSTGVIASVFLIGNYLKKHVGTVAAVLAAFFPPFIHAAHCAVNDNFVAFLICLCIICAFRYLDENRDFKWISLMAIITLLAALDKWHGIVSCAIIAIAVCMKQIQRKKYLNIIVHGFFSIVIIIVGAVLLVPNLIMDFQDIVKTLIHLTNDYANEQNATFVENIYMYVLWFFSHMGILSSIFVIMGILCVKKEKCIKFAVLLIGLIEIFGICIQDRHYIRWGYPFYVVLIIMVGTGIVYIYERIKIFNGNFSKIVFGLGTILMGVNLLAGTVLLDVMYMNSQLDTRIVSEQWCMDRGIMQFDCVYDSYTCWEPGGIVSNYPYRYGMSPEVIMEYVDGDIVLNHIGRLYAVTRSKETTRRLMEQSGAVEKAYFKAEIVFNDNGFGDFGDIPYRVSEISRINFCINKCIGIIQEGLPFGQDIAVYDISMIPAYEICQYIDYDSIANIYWSRIDKIPQGIWSIEVLGESIESGHIYIEDGNGVVVASSDYIDGHAEISMDKDCYLLTIKTDQKFDFLKFVPKS